MTLSIEQRLEKLERKSRAFEGSETMIYTLIEENQEAIENLKKRQKNPNLPSGGRKKRRTKKRRKRKKLLSKKRKSKKRRRRKKK